MKLVSAPSAVPHIGFSFDAHLERAAVGDLLIVTVTGDEHSDGNPGDTLIIDTLGHCHDKSLLLVEYLGKYSVRQKQHVHATINRSAFKLVGGYDRNPIRIIGKLVGWVAAIFGICGISVAFSIIAIQNACRGGI